MRDWRPGDVKVVVEIVSCPACGSIEILYYGPRAKGGTVYYWKCGDCSHRWKGPFKKVSRGTVVS